MKKVKILSILALSGILVTAYADNSDCQDNTVDGSMCTEALCNDEYYTCCSVGNADGEEWPVWTPTEPCPNSKYGWWHGEATGDCNASTSVGIFDGIDLPPSTLSQNQACNGKWIYLQ